MVAYHAFSILLERIMKVINSVKRALKYAKSLSCKKIRNREKLLVIEGIRLIEEAQKSSCQIEFIFYEEKILENVRAKFLLEKAILQGTAVFKVEKRELYSLAETKQPQGLIAVISQPEWNEERFYHLNQGVLLALDRIQDPGNLGTILRTAEAVGIDAVFLGKGTVDVFNPKIVRASMGSIFRLPIMQSCNLKESIKRLKGNGFYVVAADSGGKMLYFEAELKKPCLLLLIGNEAQGLNQFLLDEADAILRLPLRPQVESLNASVAAGVFLYEILRQRGK